MDTPSSDSGFSLKEKTAIVLLVEASILVWGIFAISFFGLSKKAVMARGSPAPAIAYPSASVSPSESALTRVAPPTGAPTPLPKSTQTPVPTPTTTPAMPLVSPLPIDDDVLVIALLGRDTLNGSTLWRTDSIILAFIDPEVKHIGLLSVPRDLWVQIPYYGFERINIVDSLGERDRYPGGGPALLNQTLRSNLGVSIDHYIRIDFQGFVRIIDAVGGVTVNVEKPIRDDFPDPLSALGHSWLTLPAGLLHMDGRLALSYCRSRKTTSDFDRSRRQQQVLLALWRQALNPETLTKAPRLWAELSDAFETDLGMGEAIRLAYVVYEIGPQNVRTEHLDYQAARPWTTPAGAQVLLPQTEVIRQVILDLALGPESSTAGTGQ